jgi:hypothetical protein
MPAKYKPTIRCVVFKNAVPNNWLNTVWVEQLRYMGVMQCLAELDTDRPEERMVLEIYPPVKMTQVQQSDWCVTNASRMKSFGINAIVAPKWEMGKNPITTDLAVHG